MNDSELREYWDRMRSDPRSIDELVSTALSESDEDVAWNAVSALHFRGTENVVTRAQTLCLSHASEERCLGADILGQLGVPDRAFPRQCLSILLGMLDRETDVDVLRAILIALGHLKEPDAVEPASRFRRHPDPEVRDAVVFALTGHADQRAVDGLIELSRDNEAHIRDWATFALSQMIDLDTPMIREALTARLDDPDYNARCEAIVGLATRGDRNVIPIISQELASDSVGSPVLEAAGILPNPEFYPHLVALRERCDVSETALVETLDEALEACRPRGTSPRPIRSDGDNVDG